MIRISQLKFEIIPFPRNCQFSHQYDDNKKKNIICFLIFSSLNAICFNTSIQHTIYMIFRYKLQAERKSNPFHLAHNLVYKSMYTIHNTYTYVNFLSIHFSFYLMFRNFSYKIYNHIMQVLHF